MSDHERALAHVKRVFDLEDGGDGSDADGRREKNKYKK